MEENIDIHNLIGRIVDFKYKKELYRGVILDTLYAPHSLTVFCPIFKRCVEIKKRNIVKIYNELML
jgi:hypothetical protein